MNLDVFLSYCLPLLACWFGSAILEFFYKPQIRPLWKRSCLVITIHLLLFLLIYVLFLLITQRALFSMTASLCLASIVLIINNVKYATLREPLVFSDFFLYLQIFQHPRFYLPFLGAKLLALLLIVCAGVIFAGFSLEKALFSLLSLEALFFLGLLVSLLYLLSRLCTKVFVSIDLEKDCGLLGVLVTVCVYAYKAPKFRKKLYQTFTDETAFSEQRINNLPKKKLLADIVVVQSESFFDARNLDSNILEGVLSEYDTCLNSSEAFGKLEVPAWGANTMRTEFGFLTGLTPKQLGLAQFYPYQQLADGVPSIVAALKACGYHCICIHPNAANFFMRDKFFKQLGFDEFLDETAFEGAVRKGPYIADEAVTEKIIQVSKNRDDKPCFIFAITMENHGPLHLESLEKNEWADYYKKKPDVKLNDLTIYLRHLNNADRMIAQLCEFFTQKEREVIFSLYGDHVPAISHIFELMEYSDPRSNYFIWSSSEGKYADVRESPRERVLKIEALGLYLLDLISHKASRH